MPKLKTNKAASKRYGFTGTGKVTRTKANRRHRLATKTKRTRMTARVQDGMVSKTYSEHVKKLLPYQ